jgi:hypothetical protein
MSDQWIQETVKRIKESDEEKKRRMSYEMMREQKLGSAGLEMFAELQKSIKAAIEQLDSHFALTAKRLKVGRATYDEMEIEGAHSDHNLFLKFNSDLNHLDVDLSNGNSTNEVKIPLGFNEDGEVRFIYQDRPVPIKRLAEVLLDSLIILSL